MPIVCLNNKQSLEYIYYKNSY